MRGFSLVELSIVLVILGLLVGGILAGQSLIRASELRAVTNELQRNATAIMAFRDKYMALPGDMANAYSFWGSACGGDAAAPHGCNGNGNAYIMENTGSTLETYRAWQHLALAGMIEGTYTGVPVGVLGSSIRAQVGSNIPASKLTNSGYGLATTINLNGIPGASGHRLYFGRNTASSTNYDGVMTAEEIWNIDTKMDDGVAWSGKFIASPGFSFRSAQGVNCTTPSYTAGGGLPFNYKFDDTSKSCQGNWFF